MKRQEQAGWALPHVGLGKENRAQCCVTLSHAFLHTTVGDVRLYYRSTNDIQFSNEQTTLANENDSDSSLITLRSQRNTSQFDRLYTPLTDFPSVPGSTPIESLLLEYYTSVICNDSTHIRRDHENDPLPYLLLRSSQSRVLYLGILMSAANLLSLKDRRFSVVALEYRNSVLSVLREMLVRGGVESEVIMLACMLCSSEVRDRNRSLVLYFIIGNFGRCKLTCHRYGRNNRHHGRHTSQHIVMYLHFYRIISNDQSNVMTTTSAGWAAATLRITSLLLKLRSWSKMAHLQHQYPLRRL